MTYPSTETLHIVANDGLGDWEVPLIDGYVGKVDVEARVVEILTLEDLDRLPVKKPKPPPEPGS